MKSKDMFASAVLAGAALVLIAVPARASIYDNTFAVTASEGPSNGAGFDTLGGDPYLTTVSNKASATFTYSGPLNFSNTATQDSGKGDTNKLFGLTADTISKYKPGTMTSVIISGVQVADFTDKFTFAKSSASAGGYTYGTYFTFDLGTVTAGTVLTITHDDGISLFQNGVAVGTPSTGPTGAVTDTVAFSSTGSTILRYSRQNGTPSVLEVSVPEPMSLALLGAGLAGVGIVRRRRNAL